VSPQPLGSEIADLRLDAPKEIFRCDFPGCARSFVRQDLCGRHRERHSSEVTKPTDGRPQGEGSQDHDPMPTDYQGDSHTSFPFQSSCEPLSQVPSEIQLQEMATNGERPRLDSQRSASTQLNRFTSMPTSDPSTTTWTTTQVPASTYTTGAAPDTSRGLVDSPASDLLTQENINLAYSITGLDEQGSNPSPSALRNDFTSWLFNEQGTLQNFNFPVGAQARMGATNYADGFYGQIDSSYFDDPALSNAYPNMMQPQLPVAFFNVPDPPPNDTLLSQRKRRRLIELMERRFNEGEHSAVYNSKDELFGGGQDAEGHVLSMRSMQLYIGAYWYHFHVQMPILHKPTFSADNTHDYLLLAVMAIGASCLDNVHGRPLTDAAAQLSNFIAWHLRWQIFMDKDFRPPAKLWVFQTLLLLEIYEKTHATRALHERAHIHFATTLTLMRRGSSLIGNSGLDTPPSPSARPHGSNLRPHQAPAKASSITPDEWWNRWITAESTRRAAFAAFLLDSTHAIMFGHAAIMVVNEIHLPLPCDEALWSATSPAEVGRVEASLHANNIKPTTFLDGLRKTLNSRTVRTNSFGRMILMAGLLSISWHMHQRDLQSSSLDVRQALGVPSGWQDPLMRAFDFWKKDFDDNLAHMRTVMLGWQRSGAGGADDESIYEALGIVLHHLSHIAMHADLADCQIYAGAPRRLGRTVTKADYEKAKSKIAVWVHTAGARDAVVHAAKYLKEILVPNGTGYNDVTDGSNGDGVIPTCLYNARDDFLFNRPWVLYFSALVVWCYGFALDGPLRPFPYHLVQQPASIDSTMPLEQYTLQDAEQAQAMFKDARSFLEGPVGAATSPRQLERVTSGRNKVVGLLGVVRKAFEGSRWELLHEGAERLRCAVELLKPEEETM
jgi:Fungal specific transcription factor domain